jgi:1-acyl-sn-glycerol-3-phosphate acyltransferase
VLRAILKAVVGIVLLGHLHVSGKENVPKTGGLLVVSNHIASGDPPVLAAVFPRPLHFMAKAEWFKNPVLRWLANSFLCFPVVRHTADRASLKYALALLAGGEALAIYPEGTRAMDHVMHRPEAGAGFLARHGGVPILPVAIWGTEKVLPKGRSVPLPAHVHMVYGEPFLLPEGKLSHQEVAEVMMARVAELLPPDYRGYFEQPSNQEGKTRMRSRTQGA